MSVWADLVQSQPSVERLIGTGINIGEPTDADGVDYWRREKLERATEKFLAALAAERDTKRRYGGWRK
jgi:hypothetical protein